MRKLGLLCISFLTLLVSLTATAANVPTVGIVVPLEHPAMTEIVSGFKQELAKQYPHPVKIMVKNAESDVTMQRAIISQYTSQGVDIIEPIGTDTFDMAISQAPHQKVMGIAAEFNQKQRQNVTNKQVTAVIDELALLPQLQFMQQAIPHLKKITLIYSASGKIFDEVNQLKKAAKTLNLQVQPLMIQQVSDLYTIGHHVASDSQAIFILKDLMVVSGVATLVKQAEAMHIPLIASDDGSVQGGAAFSLGVRERDIGIKSADVTAAILKGKPIREIPITQLTHYDVFLNKQHAKLQGVNVISLTAAAKKNGYAVMPMETI